jgi:hypothetical protein
VLFDKPLGTLEFREQATVHLERGRYPSKRDFLDESALVDLFQRTASPDI